jgi:ferredoxin-nitrite reductase
VLVKPSELNQVIAAIVRVFIANGNRGDRKKARLKHLLDTWTLDQVPRRDGEGARLPAQRVPLDPAAIKYPGQDLPHSHVGIFPQKQKGLTYVGAMLPVGQITPKQMIRWRKSASCMARANCGSRCGRTSLSPTCRTPTWRRCARALAKMGFSTEQSHLRSGLIACTGNRYCKYAQADTKGHAAALADYLEKRVELDQPINIHLTGCPHSCAQHYMGDIGLLGTK